MVVVIIPLAHRRSVSVWLEEHPPIAWSILALTIAVCLVFDYFHPLSFIFDAVIFRTILAVAFAKLVIYGSDM